MKTLIFQTVAAVIIVIVVLVAFGPGCAPVPKSFPFRGHDLDHIFVEHTWGHR